MAPDTKPKRPYQRGRPAGGEAAKAQIIVGPKAPVVACRLVDYSPGGACLEIFPMVAVAGRFELTHRRGRKKARVAGRRGIRIGVAFCRRHAQSRAGTKAPTGPWDRSRIHKPGQG